MTKTVELLKVALENEVRAAAFYAGAADMTEDGESHMVFLELTGMEEGHARRLVERFGNLPADEPFDAAAHLRRLEEDVARGLGGRESELVAAGDMRAVVEFAIEMEAAARDNYLVMARGLADADDRAFCEGLAAEEQKHHDELSRLRVDMDMDMGERPQL